MRRKIQRLLQQKGITQRQIARELEVSPVWISYVLHRKGTSARVMKYIARKVGWPVEEIWPLDKPKRKAA